MLYLQFQEQNGNITKYPGVLPLARNVPAYSTGVTQTTSPLIDCLVYTPKVYLLEFPSSAILGFARRFAVLSETNPILAVSVSGTAVSTIVTYELAKSYVDLVMAIG